MSTRVREYERRVVEQAHRALLAEIRRRLAEARDDPTVKNTDGSNYWGPYVTRAVDQREHDGPALVRYIKDVLRTMGESEGWNAPPVPDPRDPPRNQRPPSTD